LIKVGNNNNQGSGWGMLASSSAMHGGGGVRSRGKRVWEKVVVSGVGIGRVGVGGVQ
jgi:hypothetical protein